MMLHLIYIFLGGGIGAVLRYGATQAAVAKLGSALPGTLVVNVLGCLAMGAALGYMQLRPAWVSEEVRLFITTGLLGALTTFSTLNMELFNLLRAGRLGCALAYLGLSLLLGMLATAGGYACMARLR